MPQRVQYDGDDGTSCACMHDISPSSLLPPSNGMNHPRRKDPKRTMAMNLIGTIVSDDGVTLVK
eukprot:scaffold99426_cov53-Attheya_sp.AAC.2